MPLKDCKVSKSLFRVAIHGQQNTTQKINKLIQSPQAGIYFFDSAPDKNNNVR